MIRFHFDNLSVELPTSWDEVKVHHFIDPLFLSGNPIKLLAALSGVPEKQLANTTEDVTNKFKKVTDFMAADPLGWRGNKDQKRVTIKGKTYDVPENIELKMFGQKIMLGQAIKKSEFIYGAIPDAFAIYFGPMIYPDDWYEIERQNELKRLVLDMPISQVYPVATFFLTSS